MYLFRHSFRTAGDGMQRYSHRIRHEFRSNLPGKPYGGIKLKSEEFQAAFRGVLQENRLENLIRIEPAGAGALQRQETVPAAGGFAAGNGSPVSFYHYTGQGEVPYSGSCYRLLARLEICFPAGQEIRLQYADPFVLAVVRGGEGSVSIRTERAGKPGIAEPPEETYAFRNVPGDLILFSLQNRSSIIFEGGCLYTIFFLDGPLLPAAKLLPASAQQSFSDDPVLEGLMSRLALFPAENDDRSLFLMSASIAAILTRFLPAPEAPVTRQAVSGAPVYLAVLRNRLENDPGKAFSLQDEEQQSGVSRYKIIRDFRKYYGCTPVAFLQRLRVARAKEMLLVTSLGIEKIANSTGYENVTYFIRIFKRETGKTPSEYRRQYADLI